MQLQIIAVLAGLVTFTVADFSCLTTQGKFTITSAQAAAAQQAGGTVVGCSGFPHPFGGSSGSNAQLKFYGSDPRCNEANPKLFEYPVLQNGKVFPRDQRRDAGTPSPARVVYLQDGVTFCGVMTHVLEDKDSHRGKGDFKVCDPI